MALAHRRNFIDLIAAELWDPESWHAVITAQVGFARDTDALVHLQFALNYLASAQIVAGELAAAERLIEEDRLIAEATGNPPVAIAVMMLEAWRGHEQEASELIGAISQSAAASGVGVLVDFSAYVKSVLYNGLAGTTPRGMLPGGLSSVDLWGTGPLWCPSWPRPGRGPVT